MKPERLESLLWECVDGTISGEALADLEGHIDQHPEARELQREIEKLAKQLDGLGRAVPPKNLRARIAVALPDAPPSIRETPLAAAPVLSLPKRRPMIWLPMAASLLVGVTVGYLLQPGAGVAVDRSSVVGTMTAASPEPAAGDLVIDLGGQAGMVAVSRRGGETAIRVELATETDLEIDLEVADGVLLLSRIDPADDAGFEVTTAAGKTVLRTRGPAARRFEITATDEAVPVRFVIRSNGAVVAEGWLDDDPDRDRG
jgi:hypothetical protein